MVQGSKSDNLKITFKTSIKFGIQEYNYNLSSSDQFQNRKSNFAAMQIMFLLKIQPVILEAKKIQCCRTFR